MLRIHPGIGEVGVSAIVNPGTGASRIEPEVHHVALAHDVILRAVAAYGCV